MGRFFAPEELGLTRVLFQSATLLAQFMVFGSNPLVIRFFSPTAPSQMMALRRVSWLILGFGIVVSASLFFVFRTPFIGFYSEKSDLFVQFALWTLPMAIGLALYQLTAAWAHVLGRSVLDTTVKEVVLRFLFTLGISTHIFNWITLDLLVKYYALTPIIAAIALGLLILRRFKMNTEGGESRAVIPWKKYFGFASYNLVSRTSNFVTLTIDAILLGALVGLEAVAVYSIATYLVSFMVVPNRAVQKVAFPRVALWWQSDDRKSIDRLYGDSSSGLLFWSGILYVGFYLSTPIFVAFLGDKYLQIGAVFAVFGFGRMIEMATSINRGILRNSPVYKFETFFSIIFMITMVVLDLILIPFFENASPGTGAIGAAWGSAGAFLLFNGLVSYTLYRKYGMSPFRKNQFIILMIWAASFVFIPAVELFEKGIWNAVFQLSIFGIVSIGSFLFWAKKRSRLDFNLRRLL